MNIFYLSHDVDECARYHCDKHVVKMITEHAQLLSTAVRLSGIDAGYRATHKNHPCAKWTRDSLSNWRFLKKLTKALHDEYNYRYGKVHKSWMVIESLPEPKIPDLGVTRLPRCMPDEYKVDDVVDSYRNYYIGAKQHIASWKNRQQPEWFIRRLNG